MANQMGPWRRNWRLNLAKTEPFDAALYLTSPELQEELLNDALASRDGHYVSQALGVTARARGMTEVARAGGGHAGTAVKS